MPPKAKPEARAQRRTQIMKRQAARAARDRRAASNTRRNGRRAVVLSLTEVALRHGVAPVSSKAPASEQSAFLTALARRVRGTSDQSGVAAAVQRFADCGGQVPARVLRHSSSTEVELSRLLESQMPELRLRQAKAGFKVRSNAFMLTFPGKKFTEHVWKSP